MNKNTPPASKNQAGSLAAELDAAHRHQLANALDDAEYVERVPALQVAELPPDPSPHLPLGYYLLDEEQDRTPYKLAYPPEYFAYAKALYDEAETRPLPPLISERKAWEFYRITEGLLAMEAKGRSNGTSSIRVYVEMWAQKQFGLRYWLACRKKKEHRRLQRRRQSPFKNFDVNPCREIL